MARKSAFIYADELAHHELSETHPMKPIRLGYTYELLDEYNAFGADEVEVVGPREATDEELLGFHTEEYLRAVQALSHGEGVADPSEYNFGPGDNPVFGGMYEAARLSTGASLTAAEMLADGRVEAALSISGGLHHAMAGYASGFCVFNDPVIAIQYLLKRFKRVAYVDIDCHHGDGVQHAFYDTDKVLTISLHESSAFIFPGTGFTQETGAGRGRSHSVNVPLYPFTSDDLYLWAFQEVVPPILEVFRPDVLVTQLGIDSHFSDPIAHLALTVQGFGRVVSEFGRFAPLWLGLGGGGYDLQAVARAWTVAFSIMSEQGFPDQLPPDYRERYGVATLADHDELEIKESVRRDAKAFAENSVQSVKGLIFPAYGLGTD